MFVFYNSNRDPCITPLLTSILFLPLPLEFTLLPFKNNHCNLLDHNACSFQISVSQDKNKTILVKNKSFPASNFKVITWLKANTHTQFFFLNWISNCVFYEYNGVYCLVKPFIWCYSGWQCLNLPMWTFLTGYSCHITTDKNHNYGRCIFMSMTFITYWKIK